MIYAKYVLKSLKQMGRGEKLILTNNEKVWFLELGRQTVKVLGDNGLKFVPLASVDIDKTEMNRQSSLNAG